jgi:hemerythrin-like domain-containing protein
MIPSCHDHLPPVDLGRISAVSILSGEHRVILQTIDCLEAIARRAVAERRIPQPHADQALDIIRTFADRCHHGKEEDLLFPALEAMRPGFGPTAQMRHEHVLGRQHVARMGEALLGGEVSTFVEHAAGYAELLRQHIHKEDEILFRIAQHLLSEEDDRLLLEAYAAVEHDDMGDGTHERLLGQADALATYYGIERASADPTIMRLLTAICGCKHQATGEPAGSEWRQDAVALRYLADKVARRHGATHPHVEVLADLLGSLADEGLVNQSQARSLAEQLAALTDDFHPWPEACASVYQLYAGVHSLQQHLDEVAA